MNYRKAIDYLNSFINYERKKRFAYNEFRLKRVKRILKLLGDPHEGIKAIHIAGTKGKGSTAVFISSILRVAGFKIGLYTSPHLHDFRERIKVNGRSINKKDLVSLTRHLKGVIDRYINKNKDLPTFFEVYTILAFCYFRLKRIDLMVIEAGLGGRLDATNVIKPLVCVITPISYEHMDKLGRTLSKISQEKAGIIKRGTIVISATQPKTVLDVIKETARKKRARLYIVGKDILFETNKINAEYQLFTVQGIFARYCRLKTFLLGKHQLINAASGIGTVEALRFYNININSSAIKKGINKARWAGRMEKVSERPLIILDGAQNKASALALKSAIQTIFNYKRLILVLGIFRDKDIKGICSELERISDRIILTQTAHPRAASVAYLKRFISNGKVVHTRENLRDAIELALRKAKNEDLILVTGSLFTVGEARAIIKASKDV